jgi:hypothetical protein
MFTVSKTPTRLETTIDKAMTMLDDLDIASDEYATVLERVTTLYEIKDKEKPDRVSLDTVAVIGANLLGIMLIIRHEHVNVITSRAMGLVMKPK